MKGRLVLLPVSLGECPTSSYLPADVIRQAHQLRHFIVENAKTARAELKHIEHPGPLRDLDIAELPKEPSKSDLQRLIAPLEAGHDVGLMSEAGAPAVADPGALVVREAHENGITVTPCVGPASLLLALMASGLNGQSFAFHGYLPVDAQARDQQLKALETESRKHRRTQLFIETPYRNDRMFEALLKACAPDTRLCVARNLTTAQEWISMKSISAWRRGPAPDLARQPTIFLLLA